MAAAFFEQAMVQGAWGVIPIHLMELSPASFRTFVVGTAYQLGNLVSSASSTIETTIGERFPLPPVVKNGVTTERYEYGVVMAIFMGCVFGYVIILTFLGPEFKNRRMDVGEFGSFRRNCEPLLTMVAVYDHDFEEAIGKDASKHAMGGGDKLQRNGSDDDGVSRA